MEGVFETHGAKDLTRAEIRAFSHQQEKGKSFASTEIVWENKGKTFENLDLSSGNSENPIFAYSRILDFNPKGN